MFLLYLEDNTIKYINNNPMIIKEIRLLKDVEYELNDNIDVTVEFENGYSYVVCVSTPSNLLEEMNQEKSNFIQPYSPMFIVNKLSKKTIEEAILYYAKNDGYWLKLCQFGDSINLSVFNKIEEEHIKKWKFDNIE